MTKKKLLFLLSEDWFVCSHFLDRALAAKAAGYDVVIVANENKHGDQIRNAGLRFEPLAYDRGGINVFKELQFLYKLFKVYKAEKPDIVHQISAKPIFYGSFLARLLNVPAIVNAPIGLGYVFSSDDLKARLLLPFIKLAYKLFLNTGNSKIIFENGDDLEYFVKMNAAKKEDTVLIKGAGVDMQEFKPVEKSGIPSVVLIARMLRDKGIDEYIKAAKSVLSKSIPARFILVGGIDEENPTSFSSRQLEEWSEVEGIEWLGKRNDVAEILKEAHIACLPSYREGLPKSLIESAASGLPIVTTDTVGCREVVEDGVNGYLVPIKNSELLADSLVKLLEDETLRKEMGQKSRHLAETTFANELVIKQTLNVYDNI